MNDNLAKHPDLGAFSSLEEKNRLGTVKRNVAIKNEEYIKIVKVLERKLNNKLLFDVSHSEAPYFKTFTYTDVFGGIRLTTRSNEINIRILQEVLNKDKEQKEEHSIDSLLLDKYALISNEQNVEYEKVVFLPGSNLLNIVDREHLLKLTEMGFYIKPHPLTNNTDMYKFFNMFEPDKILSKDLSGHAVLRTAEQVATTATSELAIAAKLLGKKTIDVTKHLHAKECNYFDILKMSDITNDKNCLLKLFNSTYSGWISTRSTQEEIEDRIDKYIEKAYELRKSFKMLSGQTLGIKSSDIDFLNDQGVTNAR